MKIQTFQKLYTKFIDVILLPISILVALGIFLWQNLWQSHLIITTVAFVASLFACAYFLAINILEKPWSYLQQMYADNKKFKTLGKINLNAQQSINKQSLPKQNQFQDETGISNTELNIAQNPRHSKHIAFSLDSQKQIQQKPILIVKTSVKQKLHEQKVIEPQIRSVSNPRQRDIIDLFHFTNKKQKQQKQRRQMKKQQQYDYIDQYVEEQQFERQSQILKRQMQKLVGDQGSQQQLRREYDQRYRKYKGTLKDLLLDKDIMQKLVYETKQVVKEKIQQHLKKQHENLDQIELVLRKNFDVNFRSYKQRSMDASRKNVYGLNTLQPVRSQYGYGHNSIINQQKSAFNKKQQIGYQSLGKQYNFSEVLQQCVSLMQHNYFSYEYIGQQGRLNEIKNELKLLIRQRIQLDKYLNLKRSLDMSKSQQSMRLKQLKINCEFEQQRYFNILKLQSLYNILNQRQSAHENLLKQFFSKHHNYSYSTNYQIEQINDQKNIEFIINFIVKMFNYKLKLSGNNQLIKVQLSKPNFTNSLVNFIWVKKQNSYKHHYDIVYSLQKQPIKQPIQQKPINKQNKQKSENKSSQSIHCCPGQTNIWTCIAFIRLLISKIGLKKSEYPIIKDKELAYDFQRLVELLK